MDKKTIDAYNRDAASIAQLQSTLTPSRIYELINLFFTKESTTADIGCGIGRDTFWLRRHGFQAVGIDASTEMLNIAQSLHPGEHFSTTPCRSS